MHARLGWSYLRHAIELGGQGVIDAAAAMLPRALRGVANVVERERPVGEVTPAVRDHGLMTPAEERVIYSTCVREVLVPGFTALGIPVGTRARRLRRRMGHAQHESSATRDDPAAGWCGLAGPVELAGRPPTAIRRRRRRTCRRRSSSDFEAAIKASKDAYVALFDFAAVGEIEILLHRYDLNGRLVNLDRRRRRQQFAAEDGTPYPAERERRNVGNFYTILAQRTVGTGGCTAGEPRTQYGKLLGDVSSRCPRARRPSTRRCAPTPTTWLAKGGVVGIKCSGGRAASRWCTPRATNARGYDLITIYDD